MDIDPIHLGDESSSSTQASNDRLNALVAITVALLATFMGICKVKDDNIVQAMQQAQVDKVDQWAFYQARNLREEFAKATAETLKLNGGVPGIDAIAANAAVARYTDLAQKESSKKDEARHQAEDAQKTYDALNRHDDQFDLSDASLSIAISLLALTALTRKRWLYGLALVPTVFGVIMGLAGLLGWSLHPDMLSSLLG
ncbi:MAG: DUF4337 domain-containing protein [Dokdonella sp.]